LSLSCLLHWILWRDPAANLRSVKSIYLAGFSFELDFMPVVMGNHGIAVQRCWRIWVFHGWFWVTPKGEPLWMKLIRCRVCCTLPQIQLTLSINLTALTKTHYFFSKKFWELEMGCLDSKGASYSTF
jgi:hypothetical protein